MNKNDMIKYLAIAGGAYLVYWYLTNYNSTGAVSAANPVSYWHSWFGAATPVPAPGTAVSQVATPGGPTTGLPTTMTPVAAQPNPQPVLTQPVNTPPVAAPVNTQVRQSILAASANDPAVSGGYAIPDVWSYYWQKVTGTTITPTQFSAMIQGNRAPMSLDQFLATLPAAGLSGIGAVVTVPSAPSLPSMSFGGSFRRPGMRGMGGRGNGMGGPTIQ